METIAVITLADIALYAGGLVPCVALAAWAWRGRVVDRVPRCRRCRFAMLGATTRRACDGCGPAKPPACPECGRVLSRRRQWTRVSRVRRRWALAMGLAGIAGVVPAVAGHVMWRRAGDGLLADRPSWRLLLDARFGPWGDRRPALWTLEQRWTRGELAGWQADVLARWSADVWSDPDSDEVPGGALVRGVELVEMAVIDGQLTGPRLDAVIDGAIESLRDDDVVGNAERAERVLLTIGLPAAAALRDTVRTSDDAQQRTQAAFILVAMGARADADVMAEIARAMGDDGIAWNAGRAMNAMREHAGPAREVLVEALTSGDAQLRYNAARVLWWTDASRVPTQIVPVWMERMADGSIGRFNGGWGDAAWALRCVLAAPDAIAPELHAALVELVRTGDDQQRLCAAYALCVRGVVPTEAVDDVMDELLAHIGDNDIDGDAGMATLALERLGEQFGERVTARLERELHAVGEATQEGRLLAFVLAELAEPSVGMNERGDRLRALGLDTTRFLHPLASGDAAWFGLR